MILFFLSVPRRFSGFLLLAGWLAASVMPAGATSMQTYLTACSYTATSGGGSISGAAKLGQASCNSFDTTWEGHFTSPSSYCIDLVGTGTHPITASDVNFYGTCPLSLTWPANFDGNENFSIGCTNTALDYDKTGTVDVGTDCSPNLGCGSASVTIFNTASIMNVGVALGTNIFSAGYVVRGEGTQTAVIRIYRGDTLNTRAVNYTVSGTAVSGTDYSGSLTGSATINAGTNAVSIPIIVLANANIVGTRTLIVTLTSGNYQISTNNPTTTVGILQDVPTLSVSSPGAYAAQDGYYQGEFTVTRVGGLSNSLTASLLISGTATAGSDYTTLPSSVQFGTNQASTNLFVTVINANLSVPKTVVLSLAASSTYVSVAPTNAAITLLPNGDTTNSVSTALGRYWRGSGSDPTYWSMVLPLDFQTGTVYSNLNGNCSTLYPGLSSWSSQTLYHYNAASSLSQTNIANLIPFNNPIVAFGERVGGTPLYFNQPYQFGIYAGDPLLSSQPVIIQAYYRTNFQLAGTVSLYPPSPSGTNTWNNYTTNGFQLTTNAYGLTTILSGSPNVYYGQVSPGAWVLTQMASTQATNYFYIIGVSGYPADGTNPMVLNGSSQIAPSLLYSLEFEARPPWRSVFLNQPQFNGTPLPPFYAGQTLAESLTNTPPVTNTVSFTPSAATNLDDSPELLRSPVLDGFVANMHNDPIALANYVINQIDLTDPMDYTDDGNISEQSINLGGIKRGALGTFQEKQGSPMEQCALLVYLLRQAGVPAVYEFAPRNGMMILDSRLSQMLKFQVHGDLNQAGQPFTTNTMIAVNYPWVAAYIGTNWVHIFPWLKDYEITEGLNLYDEMPTNYANSYQWVRDYIYGNTNLLSLAVNGDNTPRVIFPKYLQQTLLQNHPGVSVDDIGVQILNRQHDYATWQAFPTPTWVTNVSTPIESLSSSAITNVDSQLTNVFDTVSVEIYSDIDPTKDIKTGNMPLVELENREFYINQFVTNGNVQLNLVLMPFRTNVTTQFAFTNDSTLLSKEVLSLKFDQFDTSLEVGFRYQRHHAITAATPLDPFLSFLGLNTLLNYGPAEEIDFQRPLLVGDQAAICMDYGKVSTQMLNADAQTLWQMENVVQASPSQAGSVSPDVYEGELMYLAGMSYYEKCDEFDQFNQKLQKVDRLSAFAAGLSKIIPGRNSSGVLTNGTDPVLPCVDMFLFNSAFVGNGTIQPASGQDYTMTIENYSWLGIADGSAEEHQVINNFYQQTNAVSTVRLLQLAQKTTNGIVALTPYNYVAMGTTNFQGQQLQNWDSGIWQSIATAFQNSSSKGYVSAYITPGPMTNALYKGMGALILSPYLYEALISPSTLNGGFAGQDLPPGTIAAANTPNYNVVNNNDDYQATLTPPSGQDTVPDQVANFDAPATASQISSGDYVIDPVTGLLANNQAQVAGLPTSTTDANVGNALQASVQNGDLSTPNDGGAQTGVQVSDPVNNITGEFYVQETDLQLPGPIPLPLHRNYSSQNLANNQFGYGWKLSIMPYLTISKKATNIFAADMDGAVMCYVHNTNSGSTNMWLPTLAANPQLDNNTIAGVGGLANRLRDYIVRSVSGSVTNYTLYGADGSVRLFQFMKFDSGKITNERPYLVQWTDNRGNYYSFSYDSNSVDSNFGQMAQIKCSNGNFLNFDYDIYGHIVDAYTGDGRWFYYDYDDFGDLVNVTLPDNTTRSYQYQLATQFVTNSGVVTAQTYSTHLIIEEDKPDGRALINAYDSQRRVTNQLSTAGTDLNPIRTATFIYTNNFSITNSFTNTITGNTRVIDGNNHTNFYYYANNEITNITDPLGYSVQQIWFTTNTNAPGYYPRSVQERIDKRGLVTQYQYDSNGNVTNIITTGDLTGSGVTSQTATNTAFYSTNCLPVTMTDPAGNSVTTIYDAVFNFLPSQIIRYSGGLAISTNYLIYGDATNIVVNGNTTQTNIALGMPVRQIRAYGSTDAATNDTFYDGNGFPTVTIRYSGTGDPSITNYYFYNERGDQVDSMDALGAVTYSDYDPLDRPTEKENIDEFGNTLSLVFYYYNENGDLSWVDGPRNNPDNYTFLDYDGAGRVTTKIDWRSQANGTGTGVVAPTGYNLYAQTFSQYDPLGNLVLKVDPRGAMTTNTYNAVCELVQSTRLDTNGVTVLSSDGFGYEPGGLLQSHTNALGGIATTFYATTGKPEYCLNVDGSTNGWRYYLDGRIYQEIQRNGAFWQTTYNDSSRITTRIFYSPSGTPEATNSVQFDRRGNVIQRTDAGGNVFVAAYDGLDRVKSSTGPAILTVYEGGSVPNSGIFITNVLQQVYTNYYDIAGRATTNVNALGEKTVTFMDAVGRTTGEEIFSATGTLVRQTSVAYSSDNNSVMTTSGSGANAIINTTFTDTAGNKVLSIANPASGMTEFALNQYDLAGNLVSQQHDSSSGGVITNWTATTINYDGLNRVTSKVDRDGALTTYAYDSMSDLTNRSMPGGLQWMAAYNNAGQILKEQNFGGSSGTRTNTYAYFSSGSPDAGLLQTMTDGRGIACTYSYDDWLRSTNMAYNGSLPEQNLTTSLQYEPRGFVTGITEQFSSTNTGPTTSVKFSHDAYGQLAFESASGGTSGFGASQSWDAAGRRSQLGIGTGTYGFMWQADGNLVSASDPTGGGVYSYDTSGLLTNRLVGNRMTSIATRDGEGRPLSVTTTVNGTSQLTESLEWSGDGLLAADTLARADFTDSHAYSYSSLSRRLTQEQLNLNSSTTWTNSFAYDNGAAHGPGVLTSAGQGFGLWNGVADSLSRVSSETNNNFEYAAYGHVNGQSTLSGWLDSQPISITGVGTNAMQWRATMSLSSGPHQLTVSALHPGGQFTAWATNSFTNNIAYQSTADSFDNAGNITNRVWTSAGGTVERTQTLSWDARGRLHAVTERDVSSSGYNWSAVYDGLNRRIQTSTVLVSNGVASTAPPSTINSFYDPQVIFLELGVSYGVTTEWKLYGPDLNGQYGGMNGTGGFDAVSPYLNLFNPTISDVRGDILGFYDSSLGSVTWNAARPTGYGAVPGYQPLALANGANVAQSSAWRGRWVDITGYNNIGLRPYDPVSGRWLSGDSAWNERDPNYYTFAGGDPINSFDSDGRISQSLYSDNQGTGPTHDQIANAFQDYLEELAYNTPLANGPYQPGSYGYLEAYINYFGWPANSAEEFQYAGGQSSGYYSQIGLQNSSGSGFSIKNMLLNTDARNYAANQWNNADWHSGWGITMKVASGVDYAAQTADAAANAIPLIGTGKALVENAAKTGIKAVAEMLEKSAAEGTEENVFHTVTSPGAGQGVLDGIDPSRLNPNSRFGSAFYVSDDADTTLAELAQHGAQGTQTIRFNLNLGQANILDLTDPAVAEAWGYSGGPITSATQQIGMDAFNAGYDVIKFQSLRGSGVNYGVLNNFNTLLTPKMIVPVP